jgi:ubiquinone/menaquinone biosynthesis C-methylase UbiE
MDTSKIRRFFDKKAPERNGEFEREPILDFEQKMRQEALLNLLCLEKGEKVLDIGCGNLRDFKNMKKSGVSYFGLDFSEEMLREGLENHPGCRGRVVLGDAIRLPFLPASFDKISMSEIIEHIPEYRKAVRGAAERLKPGGTLVVTVPNRKSLYGIARKLSERTRPWEHPHDMWKTRSEIAESFGKAGLQADKALGCVYLPIVFGRHIPIKIQRVMVFLGSLAEPFLRTALSSFGYLVAVRGVKKSKNPLKNPRKN